jgi:hypothetical protein
MAKKRSAKVKQTAAAIVEEAASVSFQNLGLEWKRKSDGSAELLLAYEGPLATRNEVIARAGTWRQGSEPWAETRELPLRRQGTRWVGTIPVPSGMPVEAVEFVFRAEDEWDNGGRAPLGYYEWNPGQRRVEVR